MGKKYPQSAACCWEGTLPGRTAGLWGWKSLQVLSGEAGRGRAPACRLRPSLQGISPPGVAPLQRFHSSQLLTGLAAQCSSLHTGGFGLGAARCCGDDGQILTLALSCSPAVPPLSSSCTRASFLPLCSPRGCLLPGSQPLTPPRAGSAGCWGFSCLTWKLFCFFSLSFSPFLLSALSFPLFPSCFPSPAAMSPLLKSCRTRRASPTSPPCPARRPAWLIPCSRNYPAPADAGSKAPVPCSNRARCPFFVSRSGQVGAHPSSPLPPAFASLLWAPFSSSGGTKGGARS